MIVTTFYSEILGSMVGWMRVMLLRLRIFGSVVPLQRYMLSLGKRFWVAYKLKKIFGRGVSYNNNKQTVCFAG
jgi:hypothetical protein